MALAGFSDVSHSGSGINLCKGLIGSLYGPGPSVKGKCKFVV